jgi:predicted ATPase
LAAVLAALALRARDGLEPQLSAEEGPSARKLCVRFRTLWKGPARARGKGSHWLGQLWLEERECGWTSGDHPLADVVALSGRYDAVRLRLADGFSPEDLRFFRVGETLDGTQLSGFLEESFRLRVAPGPGRDSIPGRSWGVFIGRRREIGVLAELLECWPVVSVVGPGGCGKTRLVQELVGQCAYAAGRIEVIRVGVQGDAVSLRDLLQERLGLSDRVLRLPPFARERIPGPDRTLIVLDGCEGVRAQVRDAIDWLRGVLGSVQFLVTSRVPLRCAGEQVLTLGPLATPAPESRAAQIRRAESVRLFTAIAGRVLGLGRLGAAEYRLIGEICRRAEGLPLYLELAAALARVVSLEEVADEMERRLLSPREELGAGEESGAGERCVSTGSGVSFWCWDRLGSLERRVLLGVSVFGSGWVLDDAAALFAADGCDREQVQDALARLVDWAVIGFEPLEGRYAMSRLLRLQARRMLARGGEEAQFQTRHLRLMCAKGAVAMGWFAASWAVGARTDLRREAADYLAAVSFALEEQRWREAVEVALPLARVYQRDGQWRAARAVLEQLHGAVPADSRSRRYGLVMALLGYLLFMAGEVSEGRALALEGRELAAAGEDLEGEAVAVELLAVLDYQRLELNSAQARFECARGLWAQLRDESSMLRTVFNIGSVLATAGDSEAALQRFRYVVAHARPDREGRILAHAQLNLGADAFMQGEDRQAEAFLRNSWQLCASLNDPRGRATAANLLGRIACERGEVEEGAHLLRDSLGVRRDLDDRAAVAASLETHAHCELLHGNCDNALRWFLAAGRLRDEVGAALSADNRRRIRESLDRAISGLAAAGLDPKIVRSAVPSWASAVEEALEVQESRLKARRWRRRGAGPAPA